MSEFSHIEITIETVAADGTCTRTTRWACPSVEMGSTRDRRVQLRFAGEPVVVAGEPTKPGTGAFWTPLDTALAIDAAARHRAAEAEIDDLAHRPGLTLDDLPRLRREAAETPPFHTGGRVPKGTIIYRHATFPHRPRSADGRRTCPAAPPDPCATEGPRKTKPMREIPIGWIGLDTFAGRVQHAEWMLHGVNPGMILETRSPGELPKRERIVSVHAISGQPAAIQFVLANGSRYKTEPWRGREEMRLLYPDGSVWWASTPYPGETTMRADDEARDVATDPRVGDRVTVGGWLRTVEAVEPGRILVYSGPRFYWRPEEWAFLCQMPGAVIERAPG